MSSSYDPTDDTTNTILTGLLPVLIFGLFNGFKNDKKKKLSFINIFDDFIIFGSCIIYNLITGIEWYQYNSKFNKILFLVSGIGIAFLGISLYIIFLLLRIREIGNEVNNKKTKWHDRSDVYVYLLNFVLTMSSFVGYSALLNGDTDGLSFDYNHISDYCIKNFGINKCKNLNVSILVVYYFGFILMLYCSFRSIFSENEIIKKLERFTNYFIKPLRWLHVISMIIYPAIISGYLISTNSITTKIAFGICSISFTRLVEHFGDGPEEVNTAISVYLNQGSDNKYKGQIEKLTEEVEKITKSIKKQTIEIKKRTNVTNISTEGIHKLRNKQIEIEGLTNEINKQMEYVEELKNVIEEQILKY
ncbi:hypothetical protein C1645_820843 [Glomus cerebriforme]|uniref:Uncharacterized protein n=1 Tax=Glomus cerebriforme TaxID=658196 RepID=A0A397T1I5_9GLOM|nr:hypothetical protein C1645_820843 [Glomus cerebriforme]